MAKRRADDEEPVLDSEQTTNFGKRARIEGLPWTAMDAISRHLLATNPEAFLNLGETSKTMKSCLQFMNGAAQIDAMGYVGISGYVDRLQAIVKFLKEYPKIKLDQDENGILDAVMTLETPDLLRSAIENGHIRNLTDALSLACVAYDREEASLDFVSTLIEMGADVNKKLSHGRALLHFAKSRDLVRLLLDNGVEVDVTDDSSYTPLIDACMRPEIDTVKLLVDRGADVNKQSNDGMTPLKAALDTGEDDIVEFLRSNGAIA